MHKRGLLAFALILLACVSAEAQCNPSHPADNNPCDCTISLQEVIGYIQLWKQGTAQLAGMIESIRLWKSSAYICPCPDSDGDGYAASFCGGTDCDDSLSACGRACYPGAIEVCDNRDNDCDGQIDESLTRACPLTQGVCQGTTQACSAGTWLACNYGQYYQATETLCDSRDNDCDGLVDENSVCAVCTPGQTQSRDCGTDTGECVAGTETRTCLSNGQWGAWSACSGSVGPATEICDGKDNDCDGQADEGCTIVSCNSCSDCSAKINAASANTVVSLSADISTSSGDCVVFNGKDNAAFSCNGRKIDGDQASPQSAGILFTGGADGNVATGCTITDFNYGIRTMDSSSNKISNMNLLYNTNGISIYGGGSNEVRDSKAMYGYWGAYLQNTNGNIVSDSTFTFNRAGIYLYYASTSQLKGLRILKNKNSGLEMALGSNNNIVTGSYISENGLGSLLIGWSSIFPSGNQIFNNYYRNAFNFNSTTNSANSLSVASDCARTNAAGCNCVGGNFWATLSGNGFSETCANANSDSFCDSAYTPPYFGTSALTDSRPLAIPPGGCCIEKDRDWDGYDAAACGGTDCDDDPGECGSDCFPGQAEICDGYDNDCDGQTDENACAISGSVNIKKSAYPTIVYRHSCAADSSTGKIYCFGGNVRAATGGASSDRIVEYTPATDTVRYMPTRLPMNLSDMSCVEDSSTHKIYCFGGYGQDFQCTRWESWGCVEGVVMARDSDDILEFVPSTGALTLKAELPSVTKRSCAEHTTTRRIYCIGSSIVEYNPATNAVVAKSAAPPHAIASLLSCASQGSRIFCMGGNNVMEYLPSSDTLTTKAATFARSMSKHTCTGTSTDIFCFGGYGLLGSTVHYMNEIYRYRPSTDTITDMPAKVPWGRTDIGCATYNNRIYCFGGGTNVVSEDQIFEYIP